MFLFTTTAGLFRFIRPKYNTPSINQSCPSTNFSVETPRGGSLQRASDKLSLRQGNMREEIQQLARSALAIDESLDAIVRKLERTKSSRLTRVDIVQDIDKIIPKWKALRQGYKDALWASRDLAGRARAAVEDYANIFMTTVLLGKDNDIPKMEIAIVAYTQRLDRDPEVAQTLISKLKDISVDLDSAKLEWEEIMQRHHVTLDTSVIGSLDTEISEVLSMLKEYQKSLLDSNIRAGDFPFSSSALEIISDLCPSGLSSDSTKDPSRSTIDPNKQRHEKLEELKQKRGNKVKELQALEALDASFGQSKDELDVVTKRLGKFASVWRAILSDLQSVLEYLQSSGSRSQFDREEFDRRIQLSRQLYVMLAEILREYQSAVAPQSGLFKP